MSAPARDRPAHRPAPAPPRRPRARAPGAAGCSLRRRPGAGRHRGPVAGRARPTTRCRRSSSRCATRTSSASRRADKQRRRVADRGGHLHRVALPRPDLARGRQGPDADHARAPPTTSRSKSGGTQLRARGPRHAADQHRLRHLVPALPARQVPRQHDPRPSPPTTRARARSTSGARAAVRARRDVPGRVAHPVQGDARLRAPRPLGARRLPPDLPRANSRSS